MLSLGTETGELQSQAQEKDTNNVPIKLWRRQKQINKELKFEDGEKSP